MNWRTLCLATLLLMGVTANAINIERLAVAETAEVRLQRYLGGLISFEAQFRQTITAPDAHLAEESSGRFYLQKPGRMRWDYVQPNEQVIVSDGVNLWLYDKDLQQVTVKSIDAQLTATPAMLLAGKQNVAESFAVADGDARGGLQWIRLVPKHDDTDYVAIELGFAGEELRAMELRDKLGQTTRIEFSSVKRNPLLAGSLFHFKPPPGADVIGKPRA
jgi:outer membrane lipoprotein carrier protein